MVDIDGVGLTVKASDDSVEFIFLLVSEMLMVRMVERVEGSLMVEGQSMVKGRWLRVDGRWLKGGWCTCG